MTNWKDITEAAQRPVFRHLRPLIDACGGAWPDVDCYNQLARSFVAEFPFTFTPQVKVKNQKFSGSLATYIEGIAVRREIATREQNAHDFFNTLTYLLFPKTKDALMSLHYEESCNFTSNSKKGGRGRTRKQDLLTLFDEGGAVRYGRSPDEIILFGHGVYEQFVVNPQRIRVFTWSILDHHSEPEALYKTLDHLMADALLGTAILEQSSTVTGEWLDP